MTTANNVLKTNDHEGTLKGSLIFEHKLGSEVLVVTNNISGESTKYHVRRSMGEGNLSVLMDEVMWMAENEGILCSCDVD
jgi:hypothetical protein